MADRRALVIGSWLAKGRNRPSHQRIRGLLDRWSNVFESDRFGFRDLRDPATRPVPLTNPRRSQIIEMIDDASRITNDTELLLYFVGHSVTAGEDDLSLILSVAEDGTDRTMLLSQLVGDLRQKGIEKLICVLDTCHAGRTRTTFAQLREHSFAMFATGTAYAFEANFSDALLQSFEQPTRKSDQRIDRRAGGITYLKLFQEARRRLLQSHDPAKPTQNPISFGDLGNLVIEEAPNRIPDFYNRFASDRTIYGRLFIILEILRQRERSLADLITATRAKSAFVLKVGGQGAGAFVSADRVAEYVAFLRSARWVVGPTRQLELTEEGHAACDRERFNASLLSAIDLHVLPEGLDLSFLDECVRSLLDDMIPPTPVRIKDRAAMFGHTLKLKPETRVALSVLPTSGRYLKGSADAIFPAELG